MKKIAFVFITMVTLLFSMDKMELKLPLSDKIIEITDGNHRAVFQLYDTLGAQELYAQLPLSLELSNFRDAQWMFYPPEKLHVKNSEAYHDGKKGELSYYAPWGDAFMLYKDFYAGDEMHRLGICIEGMDALQLMSKKITITKEKRAKNKETKMRISVLSNGKTIIYELNDSQAAKELYAQLPLKIEVENFSHNEKIFYPTKKLSTSNTPSANAKNGTLAYYAPWGDVVMFYKDFGTASGLYELGNVVSGIEFISQMSGTVQIQSVH